MAYTSYVEIIEGILIENYKINSNNFTYVNKKWITFSAS